MNLSLVVTIAVIVFLILFLIIGISRGFLRIVLTVFSLAITLILTSVLVGPVSNYIENGTVIGPRMQNSINDYVSGKLATVSGTTENAENSLIDVLPLTSEMKSSLKEKNTLAGYVDQGVNSFSEYLAVNLTTLVIRLLSYVLLFLVIFLVLKLILRLSNLLNHIPLFGTVNRIAGGIVGVAEGVLFLWLFCMIIMMLSGTETGTACERIIADSRFLTFIYEHNYLMTVVNGFLGIFNL